MSSTALHHLHMATWSMAAWLERENGCLARERENGCLARERENGCLARERERMAAWLERETWLPG